ncbi:MAG TPA: Rieske (2Fe-2S) protein [Acidimicrobiales bacterium]|nr:Rieske (2Fe-2S) protein [Acidimicrobiales bacterium]
MQVRAGSLSELAKTGQLRTKVGTVPVVVFWHDGRAWAIDDRCPHMGFPLHRGTVGDGLVTCHWHHARFDLASGCTLDLFADDARAYDVTIEDGDVVVASRPDGDRVGHLRDRLQDGLADGLTLVTAKSVLGLLAAGVSPSEMVRVGIDFGTTYREAGWGAGLTVLVAMANLMPDLEEADRPLALVHGLAFVSRDTRNRPPRFAIDQLRGADIPADRLAGWYRRFIDTRSSDAAERVLATALSTPPGDGALDAVERMMFAAVTDHVFIDGGHTLDFTNKAFEALVHVGAAAAPQVLPTLVRQTAAARRHEETASWRHPHDLAGLVGQTVERLPSLVEAGRRHEGRFDDVGGLGWRILADDPDEVVGSVCDAIVGGASPEQLGRALAYAAALRIVRFHPQNDFGDWDTVHHAFTTANALHQALIRNPTVDLLRGVVHGALRVYLDRFLNVPASPLPPEAAADLGDLRSCWDTQGQVDRAGAIAYGFLRSGGDPRRVLAHLGAALLAEDAEFHWFQVVEAGARQFHAWPAASEEAALVLVGVSRFLAAHTPTRRELPQVVQIATRLGRGEALYEELGDQVADRSPS